MQFPRSLLLYCKLLATRYDSSNSKHRENDIPYQGKHVLGFQNVEQSILWESESWEEELDSIEILQ